ncbi:MAG: hypothetical protein LCI00_29885 [Chloroflexi bacterium]|nr:hypothetical protein [Chloroflexota bacterium]MCC6893433.1 hypothetical protein [Anaerolineae bacterium]
MDSQITIDLPKSIIEQARELTKQEGRSVNAYLADVLERDVSLKTAPPVLHPTDTPYGNEEAARLMQDMIESSTLPKVIKN